MNNKINNINTGNSGEYYVAAELERRGFTVAVPMSNVDNFDILAINKNTPYNQYAMQVKTTTKDIIARIHENEEKRNKLKELGKRVAEHLGVEEIPIEFIELDGEDSRLILKPIPRIQITDHTYLKYEYLASCIAHEYRHAFQIYWVSFMNDKLAEVWREELQDAKNSENIDVDNQEEYTKYKMQAIEIDAEAFAIYYLRTFENINMRRKEDWFQRLIEKYISKYKKRL